MGRIKTQLIKRVTNKLVAEHREEFKEDFNENKKIVEKFAIIPSKKLRNTIAGYVTRLKKKKKNNNKLGAKTMEEETKPREETKPMEETKPREERPRMDDNCIFVGGKPFMNYVTGVVMQFTTKNAQEVKIKARGKFISRAVDVAEVSAKRFLEGTIDIKGIKIDSEEFQNKEGKQVRVSIIEVTLKKR